MIIARPTRNADTPGSPALGAEWPVAAHRRYAVVWLALFAGFWLVVTVVAWAVLR